MTREVNYVTFLSPGTFLDETDTRPIEKWDVAGAVAAAKGIKQRYGAKPYGFRFSTCLVSDPMPDGRGGTLNVESKELAQSGIHYLGGNLLFADGVNHDRAVLRDNMNANVEMCITCETTNSYRHAGIFGPRDLVVGPNGDILERGDDPRYVRYRAARQALDDAKYAAYKAYLDIVESKKGV